MKGPRSGIWGSNQTKAQVYVLFKKQSVFTNISSFKFINVKANLFVTPNQLVCNNKCYDEVRRNSCYNEASRKSCNDEAGLNSCYNKAGHNSCYDEACRISILLRILQLAKLGIRLTSALDWVEIELSWVEAELGKIGWQHWNLPNDHFKTHFIC